MRVIFYNKSWIFCSQAKCSQGIANFYSSFAASLNFSANIDDIGEAQNYLKHLSDLDSNNTMSCD